MSDKYLARKLESSWLKSIRASLIRLWDWQQTREFRFVSLLYLFVVAAIRRMVVRECGGGRLLLAQGGVD